LLKPQRRATSPSFPKSPSAGLSLFPQPTESDRRRTPSPRALSVHPTRPLQRSMTAPSISPNRQNFSKPRPIKTRAPEIPELPKESQADNQDSERISQVLTPSTSRSFDSDSDSEEVTIVVRAAPGQTWKPTVSINEPEWEILSKPPLTNLSNLVQSPVSQDAPSSAPLESTHTTSIARIQITSPTTAPRSADLMGSKKLSSQNETKTTIGLARSVSVSRANRPEFLKPVLVKRATEGGERLVDRQALTPTLVELKNRKSQRVQLVEA